MRTHLSRLAQSALLLLTGAAALPLAGCGMGAGWRQNQVGQRYYQSGNYAAARRSFERAMINNPYNSDYAFNVAAAMEQEGDTLAAEQMYEHALTMNPSHQPSYRALAGMWTEQGREDEAQELISAWAETQPYNAEARVEVARLQQEFSDLDIGYEEEQAAYGDDPLPAEYRAMAAYDEFPIPDAYGRDAGFDPTLARQTGFATGNRRGGGYISPAQSIARQTLQGSPMYSPFPSFTGSGMRGTRAYGPQPTYMMGGAAMPMTAPQFAGNPQMMPGAPSTITWSTHPGTAPVPQYLTPSVTQAQPYSPGPAPQATTTMVPPTMQIGPYTNVPAMRTMPSAAMSQTVPTVRAF
jgi:hypothetical protein